jgi:hypothetical protein
MQIWRWLLLFGLLFLITYNPSTRTMHNFFEGPMVETENVYLGTASGTPQGDSGPSDDD